VVESLIFRDTGTRKGLKRDKVERFYIIKMGVFHVFISQIKKSQGIVMT
jgi:hypothetical protein